MYAQCNSSGACVHFNQHRSKTDLHKCNGLKYAIHFFGDTVVSNILFYCILRSYAREASRMHAGFQAKCPLEL
jgi:hypothetical protein